MHINQHIFLILIKKEVLINDAIPITFFILDLKRFFLQNLSKIN